MDERTLQEEFNLSAPGGILSNHGAHTNAYALTNNLLQHSKGKDLNIYDRKHISKIDHHKNGVRLETE